MPIKTNICINCSSSFVPELKNQELCNECSLLEELETDSKIKQRYTQVYKKNYKRS